MRAFGPSDLLICIKFGESILEYYVIASEGDAGIK